MRRRLAFLLTLSGTLASAGPVLAAEEKAAKSGLPVSSIVLVAAIAVAVPVLFLVASQLQPPSGEEDEEIEPVVAGIAQGRAPVPHWLYLVYIAIPAWALFYMFNGTTVRSELAPPTPVPTATPVASKAPGPTSAPSVGGPVTLVAKDLVFNSKQVTLKAGAQASVTMRNQDPATPHNFAVYRSSTLEEPIFKGDLVNGPSTKTYTFTAPPAGSYYFQCDVHPTTMSGTLTSA